MLKIKQHPNSQSIDFREMAVAQTELITLLYDDGAKAINKTTQEGKPYVGYMLQVEYDGRKVYVSNPTKQLVDKLRPYKKGTALLIEKTDARNFFEVTPYVDIDENTGIPQETVQPVVLPTKQLELPMKRLTTALTPNQKILYDELVTKNKLTETYTKKDWDVLGETIPWK
jgi:hypothetical protein